MLTSVFAEEQRIFQFTPRILFNLYRQTHTNTHHSLNLNIWNRILSSHSHYALVFVVNFQRVKYMVGLLGAMEAGEMLDEVGKK